METKKCSKCGVVKPLDSFSRDAQKKDGRGIYCKCCRKTINKKYRKQTTAKDDIQIALAHLYEVLGTPKEVRQKLGIEL